MKGMKKTGQEDKGYVPGNVGNIKSSKSSGRTRTGSVTAGSGLTTGTSGGRGASDAPPRGVVGEHGGGYVPGYGKK
jgi:hypothetical protein